MVYKQTFCGDNDECGGGDPVTYNEARQLVTPAHQGHQSHVCTVVERRWPVAARSETAVSIDLQRPGELVGHGTDSRISHRRPRSVVGNLSINYSWTHWPI